MDALLSKIDNIIDEINYIAPPDSMSFRVIQFRSDLAGLLVVLMAATYENCVKSVMFDHAHSRHSSFGDFALRNFDKLNSRIRLSDLIRYCGLFDPAIQLRFKSMLNSKKNSIGARLGQNIESAYHQILDWRHQFAHAGNNATTVEEATRLHQYGKRIIYLFDRAFH